MYYPWIEGTNQLKQGWTGFLWGN